MYPCISPLFLIIKNQEPMKKILTIIIALLFPMMGMAQGWPAEHKGVMLQAFYWDSFDDTNWTVLEKQADELAQYFNLVWLPQSADCGGISMGYDDLYWFPGHYNSFETIKLAQYDKAIMKISMFPRLNPLCLK